MILYELFLFDDIYYDYVPVISHKDESYEDLWMHI